jgi:hypothetical protein
MHHAEDKRHLCVECFGTIAPARYALGYSVCLECGEIAAKQVRHTIACGNKQAYELITNLDFLKQLNPKRTS